MAFLSLPSRWTRQPTYPVRIVPRYLDRLRGFVTPSDFYTNGTGTVTYGADAIRGYAEGMQGWAFDGSTTTQQISYGGSDLGSASSAATFVGYVVAGGASGSGAHVLAGAVATGSDDRRRVYLHDSTSKVYANSFGSSSQSATSSGTWSVGKVHSVVGVFAGATSRKVALDGDIVSNGSNHGASDTADKLTFGCHSGTTDTYVLNGTLFYGGWWARAFSDDEIIEFARYPWLWAEPWMRPVYFIGSGAGAGSQTLLPSLVTDADTFHAATVTRGAVALSPGLVTDADTFHAPTVSRGTVTLSPSLVTDSDAFHAPTVTNGLMLQPSLVTDADTFHAPTVTRGAVTLSPSLVTDADTFHAATVSQDGATQTLSPSLVTDSDTFHAPSVTRGAVALSPGLVTDADTFHAATVTNGVALRPSLVTDADTFHAQTVTRGAVGLQPSLVVNSQSFYVPTVSSDGSPQNLVASRLINDATIYAHEVVRQIFAGDATDSRHRARIGNAVAASEARIGNAVVGPRRRVGKPRL